MGELEDGTAARTIDDVVLRALGEVGGCRRRVTIQTSPVPQSHPKSVWHLSKTVEVYHVDLACQAVRESRRPEAVGFRPESLGVPEGTVVLRGLFEIAPDADERIVWAEVREESGATYWVRLPDGLGHILGNGYVNIPLPPQWFLDRMRPCLLCGSLRGESGTPDGASTRGSAAG